MDSHIIGKGHEIFYIERGRLSGHLRARESGEQKESGLKGRGVLADFAQSR